MTQPNVLVLAGYGLNCEEETVSAFKMAGATAQFRHVNDVIENPSLLNDYQILAVPGGFSYGDDTGSGNAFALKLRHRLGEALQQFFQRDTLGIGICNGCQILVNLGVVTPTVEAYGERKVALQHNASNRYQCRWVDLKADAVAASRSPWLKGLDRLHVPVAHGEGNFRLAEDAKQHFLKSGQVGLRYVKPDGSPANGEFPINPNGSEEDIAAMTDATGRILVMMPHPERAILFTQRDDFPALKEHYLRNGQALPETADGLALFKNAVAYFK